VHYPGPTVTEEELSAVPAEVAAAVQKYDPRRVYDAGRIEKDLAAALQFARRHGLRLYCGEWGTLSTVPAADRLRWYRDVRRVLEKHDIGWAHWDYKSTGFGVAGGPGANNPSELLRALTGP
jgi:endoglucanase